ncbi:MAG: 2-keto-4-pentenoate hydratase [Gammaproteobacteria bacterium]
MIEIEAAAREVLAAQDAGGMLAPFSARDENFTVDDAYAVAARVHAARVAAGEQVAGRKLGFTNADMWSLYGVDRPVWAWLYQRSVAVLDEPLTRFNLRHFPQPMLEPEIVLHLCASPPPGAGIGDVLGCVDWVAHGLEIVQCHYPDWQFTAADVVADAALHASLLIGPPRMLDTLGDDPVAALETFSLALSCDGALRAEGRGENVLGNPLAALAHLVETLEHQRLAPPLGAGELVTTGTLTPAFAVSAGETWQTELDGIDLPGLAVEFRA